MGRRQRRKKRVNNQLSKENRLKNRRRGKERREERRISRIMLSFGLFWFFVYLPTSSVVEYLGSSWIFLKFYVISIPIAAFLAKKYILLLRTHLLGLFIYGVILGVPVATVLVTSLNILNIYLIRRSNEVEKLEYCRIKYIDNEGTHKGVSVDFRGESIFLLGRELIDRRGEKICDEDASEYGMKVYYKEGFFNSIIVVATEQINANALP